MQMFIGQLNTSGAQSNFIYLYDQGRSHQAWTNGNNQVRLLRSIEFGHLKNYRLLSLIDTPGWAAIYDFMPYKNGVIVSLRTE